MSVVTYTFIVFLLCTIVLYYIVPKKIQWVILLLASLVFYGYAGIEYLFLVIATAVVVYLFSLRLQKSLDEQEELAKDADRRTARKIKAAEKAKRKKFLVWALVIVIGVLAVFKAFGFVLDNIKRFIPYDGLQSIPDWNLIAPLGISFYSFMMISYLVDLYNGRISAQKNFFRYLSYVLYFPHVTQGPIARYEEVGYQLWEEHSFNMDTIMRGVWLMLWGFVKKIVIADRIGAFTKEIFGHTFDYHGGIFLAVGIAYSIQIYCDFSGCMDIVRGTSECFGIVLGENFRRPYFSQTLPEFWRRWPGCILQRICILPGVNIKAVPQAQCQDKRSLRKCDRKGICSEHTYPVCLGADRSLARRKVELYSMGLVSRSADMHVDTF